MDCAPTDPAVLYYCINHKHSPSITSSFPLDHRLHYVNDVELFILIESIICIILHKSYPCSWLFCLDTANKLPGTQCPFNVIQLTVRLLEIAPNHIWMMPVCCGIRSDWCHSNHSWMTWMRPEWGLNETWMRPACCKLRSDSDLYEVWLGSARKYTTYIYFSKPLNASIFS